MNQAVKTGIVSGIAVVVANLVTDLLPPSLFTSIFGRVSILVFLAAIYVAIKRTRDRESDGHIEFKVGLKAGVICGSISAILASIYQFVSFTRLDVRGMVYEFKQAGWKHDDIVTFLQGMTKDTFIKMTLQMIATYIVISFIISIACTLLLRKKGGLINQQ